MNDSKDKRSKRRKRNIFAKALEDRKYSPKIVRDKRKYNRKKHLANRVSGAYERGDEGDE